MNDDQLNLNDVYNLTTLLCTLISYIIGETTLFIVDVGVFYGVLVDFFPFLYSCHNLTFPPPFPVLRYIHTQRAHSRRQQPLVLFVKRLFQTHPQVRSHFTTRSRNYSLSYLIFSRTF